LAWAAAFIAAAAAPASAKTESLALKIVGGMVSADAVPMSIAGGDTLTVVCDTGVDCTTVRVDLSDTTNLTANGATPKSVSFVMPPALAPSVSVEVRICAAGANAAACAKTPAIATIPGGAAGPPATADALRQVRGACGEIGAAQTMELARTRGDFNFTVVLFDSTGPCYLSRQFGSEGDPIAVGYVSIGSAAVSLELDPCGTLAAAPKVLISADVSTINLQADVAGEPQAQWFPPLRRCFGTAAGIKLTLELDGKPKPLAYTLKQFERYRATLQIGVAASELHQRTFGLQPSGTVKKIIETSAAERGPEYIASIVFYGVSHYFKRPAFAPARIVERVPSRAVQAARPAERAARPQQWETPGREAYFGRDPVNENSALDRIGLVMGAGLNQPGRRFHVGGAFELLTGVNLFLTREFVRSPELEGYAIGDEFAGEAAAIPVRDHWRQRWSAGIALDARYALALFTRK
jgi:hypothetical protein